jgi:hypothetical protein
MDSSPTSPHAGNPLVAASRCWTMAADVALKGWLMWQLPLVTAVDWWVESIDAPLRHLRHAAEPHVHEHSIELIVPDILEEDGEHALFA